MRSSYNRITSDLSLFNDSMRTSNILTLTKNDYHISDYILNKKTCLFSTENHPLYDSYREKNLKLKKKNFPYKYSPFDCCSKKKDAIIEKLFAGIQIWYTHFYIMTTTTINQSIKECPYQYKGSVGKYIHFCQCQ